MQTTIKTEQLVLNTVFDDDTKMFTVTIEGLTTEFHSRYRLWAKAHALQYYADGLYELKHINTEMDTQHG